MDRIGADDLLAVAAAVWFVVTGLVELLARPAAPGRRAVAAGPVGARIARRVRGALELLGGLAVAAGTAISVVGLRLPFPGRAVGLTLAALALWGAAESIRPPARWLRLAVAAAGFGLAVFYAGFRA